MIKYLYNLEERLDNIETLVYNISKNPKILEMYEVFLEIENGAKILNNNNYVSEKEIVDKLRNLIIRKDKLQEYIKEFNKLELSWIPVGFDEYND